MTDDPTVYRTPATNNAPPAPLVAWLDGRDLEEKVGTAIGVYTADADGWPHPAQPSPGEVLLSPDGEVRLPCGPNPRRRRTYATAAWF
jgi:hypothetical protein